MSLRGKALCTLYEVNADLALFPEKQVMSTPASFKTAGKDDTIFPTTQASSHIVGDGFVSRASQVIFKPATFSELIELSYSDRVYYEPEKFQLLWGVKHRFFRVGNQTQRVNSGYRIYNIMNTFLIGLP